jgi:hypothetical protein
VAINLSSLSRNPVLAPPRVVMHGPHGIGKTTFGASAPGAVLLPTEDGIGKLTVDHFPTLKTYDQVIEAIGALYQEEHTFQSVVVDSLDWLEPLIWARVCQEHGIKNLEDIAYGKGFNYALDRWREFLDGLNALRADRAMAVILLAHSEVKRYDAPDTEPYDRYQIKLHRTAAALVEEWADAIFFANWKVFVQKSEVGFNKKVARGVSTGERVMHTEERPAWKAKNRYSLPPEMPLAWAAFQAALNPAP